MKLAASQELHAYWNLLRGARSAPERSEIDPSAIRGVLADTFILEADKSKRYPIRVSGTRTNCLFGRELKGAAFIDLWQAADQREVTTMLASVADEATAIVAGVSAGPAGARPLQLELLLLPLRHHGDTHARVLGAVSPASLPTWIGLFAAGPMSLLSLRTLRRADYPASARDESGRRAAFGRTVPIDRRGHLVVLRGAGPPP